MVMTTSTMTIAVATIVAAMKETTIMMTTNERAISV